MKNFWDERYRGKEFAYGEEPNIYFKEQLVKLQSGKILLPAEGEGRNGVFAACNGWQVYAFDPSGEAQKKAQQLAEKHGVSLHFEVGDLDSVSYTAEAFDSIGLTYMHFPDAKTEIYYEKLCNYLKKGGIVIFEAFSRNHLKYNRADEKSGGPKDENMLYSLEDIKSYFKNFEIIEFYETDIELHEGIYHNGKASVIRFTGKKL